MVDMAHIAGLVAAKLHPDPVPHADFVTIDHAQDAARAARRLHPVPARTGPSKINSAVFPGIQGGPLMHVIAAKAVAFGEALQPAFASYIAQVLANARTLAEELMRAGFPHRLRRHRQPPDAGGRDGQGRDRQAGRAGARRGRDHGQQEHDPVRPAQAARPVRHPPRHPGPDDAGHEGGARCGRSRSGSRRCVAQPDDLDTAERVRGGVRELCEQFPAPAEAG